MSGERDHAARRPVSLPSRLQWIRREEGSRVFINPFDDTAVIAGKGTLDSESWRIARPREGLIPVGGGGLAAGIRNGGQGETRMCGGTGVVTSSASGRGMRGGFRRYIVEGSRSRAAGGSTLADGIAV